MSRKNVKRRNVAGHSNGIIISLLVVLSLIAVIGFGVEVAYKNGEQKFAKDKGKLEKEYEALDREIRTVEARWSEKTTGVRIELALQKNGINMAQARGERIVLLQPSSNRGIKGPKAYVRK